MMSVLVVPAGFASIACVTLQKLHTRGHQAGLNLRGQYPITGVDLTRIDGIDGQTAQTILSAICKLRQNSIRVARIMAFWPFLGAMRRNSADNRYFPVLPAGRL
jgi:hypothetical protein